MACDWLLCQWSALWLAETLVKIDVLTINVVVVKSSSIHPHISPINIFPHNQQFSPIMRIWFKTQSHAIAMWSKSKGLYPGCYILINTIIVEWPKCYSKISFKTCQTIYWCTLEPWLIYSTLEHISILRTIGSYLEAVIMWLQKPLPSPTFESFNDQPVYTFFTHRLMGWVGDCDYLIILNTQFSQSG